MGVPCAPKLRHTMSPTEAGRAGSGGAATGLAAGLAAGVAGGRGAAGVDQAQGASRHASQQSRKCSSEAKVGVW